MALSTLACGLALALPPLVVDYPVVTDLPQHLGQVRAFLESLQQPSSPYVIQWATPYLLGYLLPLLGWLAVGPLWAGKVTLALCAFGWSAAVHALARRAGRGAATAALACAPFFGTSLQWGFLSFLVGFPVFAVYFTQLERALDAPQARRRWVWLGLAAVGLYATHLLWLGGGLLVALLVVVLRRAWRLMPVGLLTHFPALALAAWSAVRVHQRFDNATAWALLPWQRLSAPWWGTAAMGPARDLVPMLLFLSGALWVVHGVWTQRARCAKPLLGAAALLGAFTLFFPTRYTNTVQFETRWASPALALALLAVPAPRTRLAGVVAAGLLSAAVADTTLAWWQVNDDELSGLSESLGALPENPRVLGLSFLRSSAYVEGAPFIQTFAWAQVTHGGVLNFSFSDFSVMPVVFSPPRRGRWTNGLEWYPERVQRADFEAFDYALISGDAALHDRISTHEPALHPLTSAGTWRVYAIAHPHP